MMPEGTSVSSSADLMASVPSDLFDSASPEDYGGADASTDDAVGESASPDAEAAEAPAAEPEDTEEATEEEAPAEEPQQEQPAENLPDGVRRGKDRNGKDGLFVTPQRWDAIYGHHQMAQQAAELFGEPLTLEGLDIRNRAYIGQEKLFSDLTSGDPQAQANVLGFFLQEGARAFQDGEVANDPIVPLAQTFYQTLRDQHPDGYANLRMQAAKDLVKELYEEAGQSGNKNLWLSLGHIANALQLPYRKTDEFSTFTQQAADPAVALQKRVQELEGQLNGRQAGNQAAQFDTWRTATKQQVQSAILSDAVQPALADTQKAWEKFPDAFNDLVVGRLHSAVKTTINADTRFSDRIAMMNQAAQRATSAQKRAEIGEQIRMAYVNRAKLAVDAHKGKILQDAARIFKERSDANHQRLSAAPQRGPKGTSAPVPNRPLPDGFGKAGDTFSVDKAMADMARLFQ